MPEAYYLFAFWVGILKGSFKSQFLNISLEIFIRIQFRIAELVYSETHWSLKRETLEVNTIISSQKLYIKGYS